MKEIMSSFRLVHLFRRSELRGCGYNVEQFSELPQDILVQILLHLPVKYLIRLKVVCKVWYDLIRSPYFMSLYYSFSKTKTIPFYYDSHSIRGCNLMSDITLGFFDANVPLLKLTLPLWVDNVTLVGCCNGIVCLSFTMRYHHTFAVWNPATTQSRLINISLPWGSGRIFSGFFFDPVAESCKLVRADFLEPQKPGGTLSGILNIFTLNDNNKWRIKEPPVPSPISGGWSVIGPETCLETCMYWIVAGPYSHSREYVLCLDVVDEVFKHIIELPPADRVGCDTKLFDYRGSLAMFVWEESDCFDMWVLNDDCGGNWHKQRTLRPSKPEVMMQPLGFISKEGNDLLLLATYPSCQFLLWETNSGKSTEVIKRDRWTWMHPFFLYSESFASV